MSLKEIAELTGVSVATVARILNDPNHRTSEEIRRKVYQAARELNYIPNDAARRLKSGKTAKQEIFHIDILMTRDSEKSNDPFFHEMLRIIEIESRNHSCIIAGVRNHPEFSDENYCMIEDVIQQVQNYYEMHSHPTDGLVIIGKCHAKVLQALKLYEKNIVSINRNSTNYAVDEVICDGDKTAFQAISYLVKCGHSKIGYVGDCHNEARFAGYQRAQVQFNLETNLDFVFDTTPSESNGYQALEHFLRLPAPPSAIYCANDILAVGLLHGLAKRRNQYYTPSVISNDDIEEAQYTVPLLTTVSLPKHEMVRFALMFLTDRIRGRHKTVAKLELEGTLVIRESVRMFSELQEPEYYI